MESEKYRGHGQMSIVRRVISWTSPEISGTDEEDKQWNLIIEAEYVCADTVLALGACLWAIYLDYLLTE